MKKKPAKKKPMTGKRLPKIAPGVNIVSGQTLLGAFENIISSIAYNIRESCAANAAAQDMRAELNERLGMIEADISAIQKYMGHLVRGYKV